MQKRLENEHHIRDSSYSNSIAAHRIMKKTQSDILDAYLIPVRLWSEQCSLIDFAQKH